MVLGVCTLSLWSQQEVMVSQYMFNGLFINPAYSGSHDYWEASALHRSQWVSLDGAPVSQVIGADGPLANGKLGVGGVIVNDKIGDTKQFSFMANGSYHLDLDSEQKNRLSFGLSAGFTNYSYKFDETTVFDAGDEVFSNTIENKYVPKLGAGVYFYSDRFYAGASVPTLFAGDDQLSIKANGDSLGTDDVHYENHFFFNTGYVFDAGANLKVKPNILVKYHPSAPLQADINLNFLLYEKLWLGASYRTASDIIGIVEFNITPHLRVGYAYDFTLSDIGDYSSGGHEVMLGYSFGKEVIKMKSARYF